MSAMVESMHPPAQDEPPSTYAISAWISGEPGAFWRVLNLTATRVIFIAPGVWLGGVRGTGRVLGVSAAVSATITLGLALTYWWQGRRNRAE